jgi:hypothetical protein
VGEEEEISCKAAKGAKIHPRHPATPPPIMNRHQDQKSKFKAPK